MSNIALNNNNFINENNFITSTPTASYTKWNEWYKISEDENFEIWECCLYATITSLTGGDLHLYTPPTPNSATGDFWVVNACMKRVSGSYPTGEQFPLPFCTYWYDFTESYYEYISYKWYPYLRDGNKFDIAISKNLKTNFTSITCYFITRLKLVK